MKTSRIFLIIISFVIFLTLIQGFYIVSEYEQVVVTQFGRPVGEPITTPGIKFKIPFIQKANVFEKRYLEWDGDPNQVPTKEKKYIFVDAYARWEITDPLQFFKRLKNEKGAQSRLDDILDGETRDAIADNGLEEVVRNSNREPEVDDRISELIGDTLERIEVGREKIQDRIQNTANARTTDLGIKILDFRFKRINYIEDVRLQVYERMKSERFRIAEKFRSEGQGEASRISGERDRELKRIQSEAFRTAEEIKGKADAQAAAVYAAAYDRNMRARELYTFLKSMETLRMTFDEETTVILSTDSELYRYLKSSSGR